MNEAFITLPFASDYLNQLFLNKLGLELVRGKDMPLGFLKIRSGHGLRHISGRRVRIQSAEIESCGYGSACKRRIIKVVNKTMDATEFQAYFYDYINTSNGVSAVIEVRRENE